MMSSKMAVRNAPTDQYKSADDIMGSDMDYDGIKVIQEYMLKADIGESPIDINLSKTIPINLPPLQWHHHELPPKKMKCTNTGHTLIMSAKWHQERPHISGGPLFGNYVFSQLHFHWGRNDMEGSEHTVDGSQQCLEMHVVLFKSCYLTQEAALKKKDGIVVLVYFFKLQGGHNPSMEIITDAIPYIQSPHSSARLDNMPLSFLTVPFEKDYFMYWGTVTTSECVHCLLWLISREPIGISSEEVEQFRSLRNIDDELLTSNFRTVQEATGLRRTVFHANPSFSLYSTLLPVRRHDRPVNKREDAEEGAAVTIRAPERDYATAGAELFRTETRTRSPFKEEKNKYTISTSIKVDAELLEKLKTSGAAAPGEGARPPRRRPDEGCVGARGGFDASSVGSSRSSSPNPRMAMMMASAELEVCGEGAGVGAKEKAVVPKRSMIPRRVK